MSIFLQNVSQIPLWILISAGSLIGLIILVLILLSSGRRRRFKRELESALKSGVQFSKQFSPAFIKSHSRILINIAREQKTSQSIQLSGLSDIWLQEYSQSQREKTLKHILEFIPEQGLFRVLQSSLQKPALAKLILASIDTHGMRTFALSCNGEDFDNKANHKLLENYIDEIHELAGDPEWNARYFAIKVLLEDDYDRSLRPVIEAFDDSHPLIRKTVISQISTDRVEDLYQRLESCLIHDVSFEVRQAVWDRIQAEFKDQYHVSLEDLSTTEAYHVLDFLDSTMDDHVNLAIELLENENLELRYPAATFLERTGWLLKTLNEAEMSDQQDLKRRLSLLSAAAEVQVGDFLSQAATRPASLYLALKLLESTGDRLLISTLAEKVFNNLNGKEEEVWHEAILILNSRVSDRGTDLILKEIERVRYNSKKVSFILEELKISDDRRISEMLLKLLVDPGFEARESLLKAFSILKVGTVLVDLKQILHARRDVYTHKIRISALEVIAAYGLPYLVQMILEQLPTLPIEEARDFAQMLHEYAGSEFSDRIDDLLTQPDGKIRAAVIASIPLKEKKRVIKKIKAALKDAEPDVRIAGVWALIEVEATDTINKSLDMLRDPVTRVREAAARAMGTYGSESTLAELKKVIDDENEVQAVKSAAIAGLGACEMQKAVEILVELLTDLKEDDELLKETEKALSWLKSKNRISLMLEHMKDAEAELRDKIVEIFIMVGEEAEPAIRELLEEDIAGLKPYLIEVLEKTGYIESIIRKLSNRDPAIRRNAADFLAKVGSLSSFRGIVLAARDPDEDIRVQVTKALEYLASEQGNEILNKLKEDPDRRVRKYTAWALQRIHAKSINDD